MTDRLSIEVASAEDALMANDGRLVDLIDGLLDNGVVMHGEAWISVAGIDLVYLGIDLVLSDPETIRKVGKPG